MIPYPEQRIMCMVEYTLCKKMTKMPETILGTKIHEKMFARFSQDILFILFSHLLSFFGHTKSALQLGLSVLKSPCSKTPTFTHRFPSLRNNWHLTLFWLDSRLMATRSRIKECAGLSHIPDSKKKYLTNLLNPQEKCFYFSQRPLVQAQYTLSFAHLAKSMIQDPPLVAWEQFVTGRQMMIIRQLPCSICWQVELNTTASALYTLIWWFGFAPEWLHAQILHCWIFPRLPWPMKESTHCHLWGDAQPTHLVCWPREQFTFMCFLLSKHRLSKTHVDLLWFPVLKILMSSYPATRKSWCWRDLRPNPLFVTSASKRSPSEQDTSQSLK